MKKKRISLSTTNPSSTAAMLMPAMEAERPEGKGDGGRQAGLENNEDDATAKGHGEEEEGGHSVAGDESSSLGFWNLHYWMQSSISVLRASQ